MRNEGQPYAPVNVPDGKYNGLWSGYTITVKFADGEKMEFPGDIAMVDRVIKMCEEDREKVTVTIYDGENVWMQFHSPMPTLGKS